MAKSTVMMGQTSQTVDAAPISFTAPIRSVFHARTSYAMVSKTVLLAKMKQTVNQIAEIEYSVTVCAFQKVRFVIEKLTAQPVKAGCLQIY